MTNEISELRVPGDTAYLELVSQFVSYMARQTGFVEPDIARIRLAVDEACANVVLHVLPRYPDVLTYTVTCLRDSQSLTIKVADPGEPFNLDDLVDPDTEAPLEKRNIGGLGVFLMRRVMDQVSINPLPSGKEMVLVKHLPGQEGGRNGN